MGGGVFSGFRVEGLGFRESRVRPVCLRTMAATETYVEPCSHATWSAATDYRPTVFRIPQSHSSTC